MKIQLFPQININLKIPTLDDEFEIIKEEIETIPWYKEQGYQIVLPHSPHFQKYWDNPELIKNINHHVLLKTFKNEIYNRNDYIKSYDYLSKKLKIITKAIDHLSILKDHWSYKTFSQYQIRLTQYGPERILFI